MSDTQTVVFYYDIQCPWAYIASRRIEAMAARVKAQIIWRPVLLGAIYQATKAPQGKDGSATDVMPAVKKVISQKDFARTLRRYEVPLNFHPKHPVRTVDAVRLLHATPAKYRAALTHAFYRLYWIQNADITDRTLLLSTARHLNIPYPFPLTEDIFTDPVHRDALRDATAEAVSRGAPGVPTFWIPHGDAPNDGSVYWGQDRLHFVEATLLALRLEGNPAAWDCVPRVIELYPRSVTAAQARAAVGKSRTLTYYYDFASPWSYLAWTQLERVRKEAGKGLKIELVPVLVGGLFREIGTPMLPGSVMSEQKRNYSNKDLQEWSRFWRVVEKQAGSDPSFVDEHLAMTWPSVFPLRSVVPLRVAILDERVIGTIYKAAWVDDVNISDPQTLANLLTEHGFQGAQLVQDAQENKDNVKQRLIENNKKAVARGACGVPSFQVNGGDMVWGQDRLNVIQDLIAGWGSESTENGLLQARI